MKKLLVTLLLLLSNCGWKGSPPVPVDELYRTCMSTCPGGTCAHENGRWVCVTK